MQLLEHSSQEYFSPLSVIDELHLRKKRDGKGLKVLYFLFWKSILRKEAILGGCNSNRNGAVGQILFLGFWLPIYDWQEQTFISWTNTKHMSMYTSELLVSQAWHVVKWIWTDMHLCKNKCKQWKKMERLPINNLNN